MTGEPTPGWPHPYSAYELRKHLTADHDDDRRGAGWHELDQAHRHHHRRRNPNHTHERLP